jgi:hypothetical protein
MTGNCNQCLNYQKGIYYSATLPLETLEMEDDLSGETAVVLSH